MKFNSQKLQQCFDLAKPVLDSINETKNQVSNDIKNLEKYLISLNISESFNIIVTSSACYEESFENDLQTDLEELLLWSGDVQRLIFRKVYSYYDIIRCETGYPERLAFKFTQEEDKPLIEMPFYVRKKIAEEDHLVKLLSIITKEFDVYKEFDLDDPFTKENAD